MGPHWPGHGPMRETNQSSPGVSPGPAECGVDPKGDDRLNPMGGVPRLQAREEIKRHITAGFTPRVKFFTFALNNYSHNERDHRNQNLAEG
jgi:hypothetical protein